MGMVSQFVARVKKSQPGSSSVHVNAPLGSEKDRVGKATDDNPALNNQGVELAVEALWPEELDEPLAVEKSDHVNASQRRRAERREAVDNAVDNPGITSTVEKGGPGSGPQPGHGTSGGRGHEMEKAAFEAKYPSVSGKGSGVGAFHSGGHTRDEAKSKAQALRAGGTHATIWHVDGPKTGGKSSYAVAVPHSAVAKGGPGSGPHPGGGATTEKKPKEKKDPKTMTVGELKKESEKLSSESSKLTSQLIDEGHGSLVFSDMAKQRATNPLFEKAVSNAERHRDLHNEAERRGGPGFGISHLSNSHNNSRVHKAAGDEPRRVATVAIRHGDHLLMGKRRDNDKWTTPGGHVDPGEDFHAGALREALEETGIELDPDDVEPLTDVHELTDKEGAPLHVQPFVAHLDERPATSMQDDPDGEVYRWQWVDISDGLPEEMRDELHTPLKYNVLMQALGLAPDDPDNVNAGDEAGAETGDADEALKLDLGSGQARAAGHIGVDLYAYDDATLVHDLVLGLPFEDESADSIRLVNALHDMEGLSENPGPLLAEILRVLQPGGTFHYEGPHEITEFPDGLDETDHVESVVKEAEPGWHQQTFERAATPDAATSDDTDPRLRVTQYDMLPADAVLALDATANAWSDATASGGGNRIHGYPSQGALVAKSAAVDFVQKLLGRPRTEVAPPGDAVTLVAKIGMANRAKQIIYCVVLSPEESDQQEDFMLAEDIEIAAHRYMLNSRLVGSMHTKLIKGAAPVESYIAPMDMKWDSGPYGPQTVKKGAWVVGLQIFDKAEWAKVEDGTYQSVSVSGIGLRDDMN